MADFFEVIRSRRSVRSFAAKDVSESQLHVVLDAMNRAPSAGNLQAYEVVVVREAQRRRLLARAAVDQDFVATSPVVLVFLESPARSRPRYGRRGAELYCRQDATIAAAHAQLAAHALGLGTVWVGAFDDDSVRRALEAPADLRPVAILVIGHPAETPEPTPRRALRDIVHRETIGHHEP